MRKTKDKDGEMETNINIELNEKIAEGEYSNLVMIGHSKEEFILDFIRVMPGVAAGKVKSRIIVTPRHAKRFLHALAENIERFEESNGPIEVSETPETTIHFGGGHVGEA